jgi:hypothetical protein
MLFPEFNMPSRATHARMAADLVKTLPNHYRIALTGAQRTGKTTMAKAYAETMGIPYVDASVSKILAANGLDSSATYSDNFGKRLTAQRKLLEALDNLWDNTHGGFVTDRSPLCFAMYTLSDIVGTTNVTNEEYAQLMQYINECKAATLKHFNTVVLVPLNPKIELVSSETSATANPAFIHHLHTVITQLFDTVTRRCDSEPEDDEMHALVEPYLTRPDHGQALTAVIGDLSDHNDLTKLLFEKFACDTPQTMSCMTLPNAKLSVKDRVNWLRDHQQFKAITWLNRGLAELSESPMIGEVFSELEAPHFEEDAHHLYRE